MKKTFGLILSLVIGAALLAACGSTAKSNFSLQISMEGVIDIPDFVKGTYGPDTVLIPLELKQDTYEGSYSGEFHAKMTGVCNATATYPVTFDVSAKGEASNNLNFILKSSMAIMSVLTCEDQSGEFNKPPLKGTITFTLPAVNGASYVWNAPKSEYGSNTWTFTLKKQ